MSINHQHIIYTAEDIKRYLAGNMSNDEMHVIEKAALDDPLLSDAIDGYADAGEQNWNSVVAELKNKIGSKEDTPVIDIKSSTSFKWWKAAAAVLLIGISGTIAYVMNANKEKQGIAATEKTTSIDSSTVAMIEADSVDEKTIAINEAPKRKEDYLTQSDARGTSELISEEKNSVNLQDSFVYKPSYNATDREKKNVEGYNYNDDKDAQEKEVAVQNAVPSAPSKSNNAISPSGNYDLTQNKTTKAEPVIQGYSKQDAANFIKQQYQFKGTVLSKNGEPISFANLKLTAAGNKLITTDAKGLFNIQAHDSILTVEVTSAGFAPAKFRLDAWANNGLTLQPSNAALNEVTISSNVPKDKLAKKRVNTVDDELEETAEPTGGWDSYNEYLNNNLHMPSDNQNNLGTVEAIVKVNRKGEVDDVKITQSVNAECDKEAVRLIKSGPAWKLKAGKKGYGKVKVRFQR